MDHRAYLGASDYAVIGITLLIPTIIGLKFRSKKKRDATSKEYLLAGKDMSIFPVIMSITVTMISGISMLGQPAEIYRYGLQVSLLCIGFPVGTILSSYIFLPVYFQCDVSTSYEFLEMRYGKIARLTISGLFLAQMILFMSVVLYAPVLALSAVTDLSLEASIIIFGLVCSFYCAVGGLKAVIWTDVFQASLILLTLIVLYIKGIGEAGGISEIYRKSAESQRLNIFEFKEDFVKRYTFINVLLRGIIGGMAYYGVSQIEVQRMLSLKSLNRAKSALNWSIIPATSFLALCMFLGLMLYAIFDTCDPVKDKMHTGVQKYDQIVPYYIVSRFSSIPGLTGLCVAGIFSGSLSTLSSALNSLSAVTVFDLIKPLYKSRVSETRMVYIAKILSLCYGIICICLTFVISRVDSLVAINNTLLSVVEGPVFAVFCIAVLSRKGSEKCILFGLLSGVLITAWVGCGIQISGYYYPALLLDASGCPKPVNGTDFFQNLNACNNLTQCLSTSLPSIKNEPFFLYKISFLWLPSLGFFTTLCAVFIAVILTGWRHNAIPVTSECLSPVTRFWIKVARSEIEKKELSKDLEEKIQLTAL
ncbi:sodium-coupled monocarboxylate transporter 1 [Trichonephila clavata]|uniref:Sodium-coupled monocarboxylate transporter 1 n=1 Tax=Trichonephila clavata TaxID=2740835 RepID=A0A8X6KR72_TRICU|nr:sodium-coupled monocarboxylate transporter 1 [Trichonephila clavata]